MGEAPGATPTMADAGVPPMTEARQRALENHFSPEQLAALDKVKARATAEDAAAGADVSGAEAPAAARAAKEKTDEDVVVDFSAEEDAAAEGEGEAGADEAGPEGLSEEELAALDARARKAYLEANKEAAKVRKRAQEAEARAAELAEKLKAAEEARVAAGDEVPAALNAHNSLAHVTDERLLAAYERDAQNVLARLREMAAAEQSGQYVETVYKSLVDGKDYDLSEDSTGYASWAAGTVLDAEGRRKQLTVLGAARESAKKLEARLKETPGFEEALKAVTGQALVNEWPRRRVQAAIGELVTSGQYRLIKVTKGSAGGASAGLVAAPTPAKADKISPPPRREPGGSMPNGSPANGEVSNAKLRALHERAMKTGAEDDIKALMKAKMEARRAVRLASA